MALNPLVENLSKHDHTHLTYDPSRSQLLAVDPTEGIVVYYVNSQAAPVERILGNPTTKGNIRHVKVSPKDSYIGIAASAKTTDIYAIKENSMQLINSISKDLKASDVILGFEWTFDNEFFALSRVSVDFYSQEHKTLLLSGGSGPLYLFNIKRDYKVLQLPSLDLTVGRGVPKGANSTLLKKNISLLSIYDRMYCALLEVGEKEKESQLFLYRISTKTAHKLEYVIRLENPGPFLISEVDNLILAHSLQEKVTAIYDIENGTPPNISKVLPHKSLDTFGTLPTDLYLPSWQPFLPDFILSPATGTLYQICINLQDIVGDLRASQWTDTKILEFLFRRMDPDAPHIALRIVKGMMEKKASLATMRQVFRMINELVVPVSGNVAAAAYQRRAKAIQIEFELIRRQPQSFHAIRDGFFEISERIQGIVTFGTEILFEKKVGWISDVWIECVTATGGGGVFLVQAIPLRLLQAYLIEYIHSTSSHALPTLSLFSEMLVSILLQSHRISELQMYLTSGVVPFSSGVALLLVHASGGLGSTHGKTAFANVAVELGQDEKRDVLEVGLMMLGKLGLNEEIVEALLGVGRPVDALRHAIQTSTLRSFAPAQFLESSYQSGDRTQFLNVYRELEDRNLIPVLDPDALDGEGGMMDETSYMSASMVSGDSFPDGDGGMGAGGVGGAIRFVSIYREIWGEVVEMEGI
ncbi:hypothetical protein HDU97_005413 [Phlyctochytrium planicorne]|nr:hypothetical protein HDU97_005413 [Phlyctochytrium planicorne]